MLLSRAVDKEMANVSSYGQIRSDYATVSLGNQVATELQATNRDLKPIRAKVAPAEDLEMERRKITQDAQQDLVLIQVVLFIVFLCLLCYVVLPQDWAHAISFLLLCVGIASGFFLKRK
jgi:hypothetical protein